MLDNLGAELPASQLAISIFSGLPLRLQADNQIKASFIPTPRNVIVRKM